MAGSELDGLDGADGVDVRGRGLGADADRRHRGRRTFAEVASVVAELGADVVALPPERHDQVVAVISHVPHLAAATLMGLASDRAEEHAALLRLAAGGFRDMTRIASRPSRRSGSTSAPRTATAILSALDGLIDGLGDDARRRRDRRPGRAARPAAARPARRGPTCPSRVNQPSELAEVRIPIPDRPGAAAEVFTLAAELGRQHRQLRGRAQRRGQPRCRRRAGRRDGRRAVPRRPDGARVSAGRQRLA